MKLTPHSWLKTMQQAWRTGAARRRGAALGTNTLVGAGVVLRRGWGAKGAGRIAVGPACQLETGVVLEAFGGAITLGEDVFLGPYVVIYGHGGVTIGAHTLVAMHCRIVSSNHAIPPRGVGIRSQPDECRPTRIGQDVWLGAGVTVLGGVTIGDGCIVGAGALVTKDLPPGAIAFGSPCSVRKFRPGYAPA